MNTGESELSRFATVMIQIIMVGWISKTYLPFANFCKLMLFFVNISEGFKLRAL